MKDYPHATFQHGKEWITKVVIDGSTWYPRPATKAEIEQAKAWQPEATTVTIDGVNLPWMRPDPKTAVAGVPLPAGGDVERGLV